MLRIVTVSLVSVLLVGVAVPALAFNSCKVKFGHKNLATGTNPQTIVTGDFNRDGNLDFALVDYNGGNPGSFSVFLGKGDGTFKKRRDYPAGSGPDALAVGDVNGDGILDLVTGNDLSANVSVFLGNGDGTFAARKDYGAGSYPHWVTLADFNGDHAPDIVVTNEGGNTVGVLLNNGDGTFGTMKTFGTPSEPYAVAAADFNGDKKLDLAVTGYYDSVIAILIGKGDGTFKTYTTIPTGSSPAVVLATDFNNDGKQDLATLNYNSGQTGSVSVMLGNGDGTFGTRNDYPTGTGPDGLAVGNFTGDRWDDLAVADLIGNTMSILAGHGDGTFDAPKNFPTPEFPLGIVAGTFHGQSAVNEDVIVSNDLAAEATVFSNRPCE